MGAAQPLWIALWCEGVTYAHAVCVDALLDCHAHNTNPNEEPKVKMKLVVDNKLALE